MRNEKPVVPAENFLATVSANVDNEKADPEFETMEITPISKSQAEKIKQDALTKYERLAKTNPRNWKRLAAVEEIENSKFDWHLIKTMLSAIFRSWKNRKRYV